MIKKLLISLFVIVFWFIGFSNASTFASSEWSYLEVWLTSFRSPINNSIDVSLLKGWSLLSSLLWNSKRVFALDNNIYAFWTTDWRLYVKSPKFEWYFDGYFICDPIVNAFPSNCGYQSNWNSNTFKTIFKSFFNTVVNGDLAYYKYYDYEHTHWHTYEFTLCWSSDELDRSICFSYLNCADQYACNQYNRWSLSDSQGYNYSFSELPDSILWYAPWHVMYDDWSIGGDSSNHTNQYYWHCPTIQQLINSYNNYSSNYDPSLCYTPWLIYSGWSVVSVTPTSMFDIFSSSDVTQFRNYRDLYLQNCHAPYTQEHCQSVFQWHDLELSLVSKIPDDIKTLDVYQYCRLNLLYPDKNTTTCVWSWVTNWYTWRTNQDVVNDIADWNYTIIAPNYTSIANNVFGTEYTGDIITNLQDMYTKFNSLFSTRTWSNTPVLPTYIVSMLLVIILFRLFKK